MFITACVFISQIFTTINYILFVVFNRLPCRRRVLEGQSLFVDQMALFKYGFTTKGKESIDRSTETSERRYEKEKGRAIYVRSEKISSIG